MALTVIKKQIDDYIYCQHKFAFMTSMNKYKGVYAFTDVNNVILQHKENLNKIAIIEMRENIKLSIGEYRIRFTNALYTGKISRGQGVTNIDLVNNILDSEVLTINLNNFYHVFANNAFIGYNIPIELPIAGTNIVYSAKVGYGLVDDEKNLTFVDLVDMSDPVYIKDRVKYWAHYSVPYSFLATSFNKPITVLLKDPNVSDCLELHVSPSSFDDDYKHLCEIVAPMQVEHYIRNLNLCKRCMALNDCFGGKKKHDKLL